METLLVGGVYGLCLFSGKAHLEINVSSRHKHIKHK